MAVAGRERIAGVSAFGFGGTNFHVVLSAYPNAAEPRHAQRIWPAELFCFRGADRAAAHQAVRQLLESLAGDAAADRPARLAQLAASVAARAANRPGTTQVAVVARDLTELETLLHRALAGEHDPARRPGPADRGRPGGPGQLAFLFPGQGSQRPGALGRTLRRLPRAAALPRTRPGRRRSCSSRRPPSTRTPGAPRRTGVRDTRTAQPALGIGGLAVDHLLRRLGVTPGHDRRPQLRRTRRALRRRRRSTRPPCST